MHYVRYLQLLPVVLTLAGLPRFTGQVPSPTGSPPTQKALVVLFTPGGHWRGTASQFKTMLYGTGDYMSNGSAFDGRDRIATFSHSRYLVLRMAPGEHTFSASESHKHRNDKETLVLHLKAGSTTYLALTSTITNYGLGVYNLLRAHLSLATCEEFAEDHGSSKSKPVFIRDVADRYKSAADIDSDVLKCAP